MITRLLFATALALCLSTAAYAQDSAQNGSRAAEGSVQAAGALAESGVQTASAAAVLPASVVGGASVATGVGLSVAGVASEAAADESTRAANGGFGRAPLPLDRRVVTAQPAPRVPYDAQTPLQTPAKR